MFLSLIKILLFVAVVMGLTFGATMLMDVSGGATIAIAGIELTLSPLQLTFALVALIVLVWLGLKLTNFLIAAFRFLNGDETAISRYFDRNRERKGFEALSEGMMALASGEGHLALTKAQRAEKLLKQPQLTNLLTAQAAEMTGDKRTAEATYKKLLEDEKTRFVGVRGIMKQKLQSGDTEPALKLAKKAFLLKPKHEETQDVLLKLQAKGEDWKGARETLGAKLKSGNLPRDVYKRRDAVLALSEARDMLADGKDIEQVCKKSPANAHKGRGTPLGRCELCPVNCQRLANAERGREDPAKQKNPGDDRERTVFCHQWAHSHQIHAERKGVEQYHEVAHCVGVRCRARSRIQQQTYCTHCSDHHAKKFRPGNLQSEHHRTGKQDPKRIDRHDQAGVDGARQTQANEEEKHVQCDACQSAKRQARDVGTVDALTIGLHQVEQPEQQTGTRNP
jgi:tetratricopeptide (TPR) repeat protein